MKGSEGLNRLLITALFGFLLGFAGGDCWAAEKQEKGNMQLTSTAFTEGAEIPAKYTCDQKDVSPSLKWIGAPAEAKSFVLIADDPDAPAGTWVHWVLYDLPAGTADLPEGLSKAASLPNGAKQGVNDFGRTGYGGPCPPPGKPHRYFFKLYALDAPIGLKSGATKKEVESAMAKHVLAQCQLMGLYRR
jgi:Raf kinase inhibitor-like YbhB/YbcL family protein